MTNKKWKKKKEEKSKLPRAWALDSLCKMVVKLDWRLKHFTLSKWEGVIVAFVYRLTDSEHLGCESLYCGKADNKLETLLCLGMFQF